MAHHVIQALTLEDRRDAWHHQDASLNGARRAQSLDLWRLWLSWQQLYPKSSMREFVTWAGYGEYNGRYYAYLRSGLALASGYAQESDLRLGELDSIGQVLLSGVTPAAARTAYDAGGVAAVRQLTPATRETVPLRVPAGESDAIQAVIRRVSESDNLQTPEAHARIVQSFGSADPVIQRALLHQHATGEDALSALMRAADEARDVRRWLSEQGCMVCGVKPVELHHLRVTSTSRFRTGNLLAPLCTRHHIARPGDTSDAVHAATQDDWAARHFTTAAAFYQSLAALYATWADAQRRSP